jgi:hypothetical protein
MVTCFAGLTREWPVFLLLLSNHLNTFLSYRADGTVVLDSARALPEASHEATKR